MNYSPDNNRYDLMPFRRSGKSGLLLPAISLGLWHNFGSNADFTTCTNVIKKAFDLGITHFDLANNYGPPPGSAELNFGKILKNNLKNYRDELIVSTKAGYEMWPGPYGNWGSRKSLIASCNQSLKRMELDYVDIFYTHRPDPETPIEETMFALDQIVRSGKALYIGISRYSPEQTKQALAILKELKTPCIIHQEKYSLLHRTPEKGILSVIEEFGIGSIVFSPLAQGLLTNKYLKDVPKNSRAADSTSPFLEHDSITESLRAKLLKLNKLAENRNQSLAQMALSWILSKKEITSVLVGARNAEQITNSVQCISNLTFSFDELTEIDVILSVQD